jgi:hypothetical protein
VECVTIGLNEERLAGNDVSKPKSRTATYNQKLLILSVVVVAAARDPRMSGKERNLTRILRSQHFSERAAGVNMVGDWIRKVCRQNVTEICGVQRPQKSNPNRVDAKVATRIVKVMNRRGDLSNRG